MTSKVVLVESSKTAEELKKECEKEYKVIDFSTNGDYSFDAIRLLYQDDGCLDEFIKRRVRVDEDEEFLRENVKILDQAYSNKELFNTNNVSSPIIGELRKLIDFNNKKELILSAEIQRMMSKDSSEKETVIILENNEAGLLGFKYLSNKYNEIALMEENYNIVEFSYNLEVDKIKEKNKNKDAPYKAKSTLEILKEFKTAFVVGIVVFVIFKVFLMNCIVPTGSMEDTMPVMSFMVANRLAYKTSEPQHGDIVVFKNKKIINEFLTKRVIAIEGDVLEFKNNSVYLNNKLLDEEYVKGHTFPDKETIYKVPKNKVFLMGDNRENSFDARFWEDPFIDKSDIYAKGFMGYGLPFITKKVFIKILK